MAGSIETLLLIDDPAATAEQVQEAVAAAAATGSGVSVEPSLLHAVKDAPESMPVASWAGYPTGKHHTLIKAAEARLAIQSGATRVALVPDVAMIRQDSAFLSELIAVREAVPHPALLGVVLETTVLSQPQLEHAARLAVKAGMDFLVAGTRSCAALGVDTLKKAGVPVAVVCEVAQAPEFAADSYWVRG